MGGGGGGYHCLPSICVVDQGPDLSLLHHNNRQYTSLYSTSWFREFHFRECFDSPTAARCYFCLIDEMDGRQTGNFRYCV